MNCPNCGSAARSGANFCSVCGHQFPSTAPGLRPGQVLRNGDYRIVRRLGKGGMGTVYLAENHQAFGKPCVVKEMLDYYDPSNQQEAASAHRRFEGEARTLAQLNHPGIPDIQAYFSEGGHNYIVMEFVEGMSLEEAVTHENEAGQTVPAQQLTTDQVLRYGVQLCEVLEYLAGLNPPVVHQDIKPANIIIDTNWGTARLVDFGTAKARPGPQATGGVGITQSSIFGTQGYAPLEQYNGQSEPRSDVYALAVTLHHLLTDDDPRAHPFQPPSLAALAPSLRTALEPALRAGVRQRCTAAQLRQALAALQQPAQATQPIPPVLPAFTLAALDPHESYAVVAEQGVPDAARPTVIQYLVARRALTPLDAEVITWRAPASLGVGLDVAEAFALMSEMQAFNVPVKLFKTSQVAGWRDHVSPTDVTLLKNGEVSVTPSRIPPDRVCHCYRCGYQWTLLEPNLPQTCPSCQSADWRRHRLFRCSVCGHQFTHGGDGSPENLFPVCPSCQTRRWRPALQPRLRGDALQAKAGTLLTGHTKDVDLRLAASGSPALRGRVTPNATWLAVRAETFSGESIAVTVNTVGLPTKQTYEGTLDIVCDGGHARAKVNVYVDEPAKLALSDTTFDVGLLQPKTEAVRKLSLQNLGGQVLRGSISGAPPWLQLSRGHFQGDVTEVQLTIREQKLPAPGQHTATLTVQSTGGDATVTVSASALPPRLALSVASVDLGEVGPRQKRTVAVTLTNSGGLTLEGSLADVPAWLRPSATKFRGDQREIRLTVHGDDLPAAGEHSAALTFDSNGGRLTLPVKVTGLPTTLALKTRQVDFGSQARRHTTRRSIHLVNSGVGALEGTVTSNQPWLKVERAEFAGKAPRIAVVANTEGLDPLQSYTAELHVASNGGEAKIPVTLRVSPYAWPVHIVRQNAVVLTAIALLLGFAVLVVFTMRQGAVVGGPPDGAGSTPASVVTEAPGARASAAPPATLPGSPTAATSTTPPATAPSAAGRGALGPTAAVESRLLGLTYRPADPAPPLSGTPSAPSRTVVESVRSGGPAEQAGVRPGDTITLAGGQPVGPEGLAGEVDRRRPGDRLELTILRDGQLLTLTATLAAPPP